MKSTKSEVTSLISKTSAILCRPFTNCLSVLQQLKETNLKKACLSRGSHFFYPANVSNFGNMFAAYWFMSYSSDKIGEDVSFLSERSAKRSELDFWLCLQSPLTIGIVSLKNIISTKQSASRRSNVFVFLNTSNRFSSLKKAWCLTYLCSDSDINLM